MADNRAFLTMSGGTQPQAGVNLHRSRPMFVSLKNRLHLPGVNELIAPCTNHLTPSQYKRMLSAWQTLPQYHVFGFVQYERVIGLLAIEVLQEGAGRVLTVAVPPNQQGKGFGRRLIVEAFCSLDLETLSAKSLDDILGFYEKLNFDISESEMLSEGIMVYSCVLTRANLYKAYIHEYSAGAVLFCENGQGRRYVLVTELSGNTGLPKGHVEEGETTLQTALREIYEETGLEANIIPGFGGEIVYPQGKGMLKHFTYYLAHYDPSVAPVSGPDVVAHVLPYDQALRKLSFADVRAILRKAEEYLNSLENPAQPNG